MAVFSQGVLDDPPMNHLRGIRKEALLMGITFTELYQLVMIILGVITVCITIDNKRKK